MVIPNPRGEGCNTNPRSLRKGMGWKSQNPEDIGEIPEEECWDGSPGSLGKRPEHQSQIPEE